MIESLQISFFKVWKVRIKIKFGYFDNFLQNGSKLFCTELLRMILIDFQEMAYIQLLEKSFFMSEGSGLANVHIILYFNQ